MKIESKKGANKLNYFITKHSSFILFLIFLVLISLAGLIFYKKIYQFLEKENQMPFLTSGIKKVKIDEDIYKEVFKNLEERKTRINEEMSKEIPNPFK